MSTLGALVLGALGGGAIEKLAKDLEPSSPDLAATIRAEGEGWVKQIAQVLDETDADKKRRFRVARISDMATQLAASCILGSPDETLANRSVKLAAAILDAAERHTEPKLEGDQP